MQTKTKQTSNNKMLAIAILVSMFILVFFVSIFAGIYVLVKNNPNFQKIYSELETGKSNTAPTNLQNQNPKSETNIDQPSYQELKLAYDELIKQNAELEKKVLELQPKTESMQTQ